MKRQKRADKVADRINVVQKQIIAKYVEEDQAHKHNNKQNNGTAPNEIQEQF